LQDSLDNDQLVTRSQCRTQHIKMRGKHPWPQCNLNSTSSHDLPIKPHRTWDPHKHNLNCLIWLIAHINLGCDFCEQFQYNISLITGWNKSYYGVVCMHNFPAGHLTLNPLTWKKRWAPNNAGSWQMGFNSAFKALKHLKSERILPATSEQAGFGSSVLCILPANRPSQLCLACTLVWALMWGSLVNCQS